MDIADPQELRRLTSATESTYKLILSGTSPNDAVVKTASAQKFNENWSRRLCELTNRVLALDHMENSEKKAAAHPVVDPDSVVAELFPTSLKPAPVAKAASQLVVSPVTYGLLDKAAAASDSYVREGLKAKGLADNEIEKIVGRLKKKKDVARKSESDFNYVSSAPSKTGGETKCAAAGVYTAKLPDVPANAVKDVSEEPKDTKKKKSRVAVSPSVIVSEKKASEHPLDPVREMHRKSMMIETVKRAMKDLRAFNHSIEHNIAEAMRKAARALDVHPEIKFKDVEERTLSKFGYDADAAVDILSGYVKEASRFSGKPRVFTTNPWNRSPFIEINDAVKTLCKEACVALFVDKQIAKCEQFLSSAVTKAPDKHTGTIKAGSGLADMATASFGLPGKMMTAVGDLKSDVESSKVKPDIADTVYGGTNVDNLGVQSSIDARMSLADALSDDVISTYPVSKVISTYNRLADIYPRAVIASATLIPMLRRTLANPDVEAHDITLSQKVEEGLAKSQDPTKIS